MSEKQKKSYEILYDLYCKGLKVLLPAWEAKNKEIEILTKKLLTIKEFCDSAPAIIDDDDLLGVMNGIVAELQDIKPLNVEKIVNDFKFTLEDVMNNLRNGEEVIVMKAPSEPRIYLTPIGRIVAAGEITLRMKETGKTAQEVMDDNEIEIQKMKEQARKEILVENKPTKEGFDALREHDNVPEYNDDNIRTDHGEE
jgi:hypothetical protein